ncbi:hypothetical protein QZH41_006003 [Actinostola sp. cb2023]|nr:hypothetical protein QZH41_006003 [Actinostola sp. cb2023]
MADIFNSDDDEEFEGFTASDNNPLEESMIRDDDEESDISVSTVNTEDLSDFDDEQEVQPVHVEETTWSCNTDPVTVSEFTARAGPLSWVPEDGTAIDFFRMFPEELFELMATETNRYTRQRAEVKPDPKWRETTSEEIKAFLGLHVLFGIKQLPSTRLYWSANALIGVQTVKKIMPRNLFDKLTIFTSTTVQEHYHEKTQLTTSCSKSGQFLKH